MFIKPLLTAGAAEDFVKKAENKYCIIFLPSASASGYLRFKQLTDPLVLILLEHGANAVPYNALAIEGVAEFKEKKEILIDEGIAFFVDQEVTIMNKTFDYEKFEDSLKKFKNPVAKTTSSAGYQPDYNCSCCVIL
ncbi:hypothetical protein H4R27_000120 [Coemansia aciculifera]|nr:hypothetical protein H4R27_000120 [Coemansia aciculifera]